MGADEMAPDVGSAEGSVDADLTWWRVVSEPAVAALLLATIAHVARRNVTDIVLFLGMAGVIAMDRVGGFRESRRIELPAVRPRAVVAGAIGYGLVILPLVRGGGLMRVALAAPGLAALLILLSGRTGVRPLPPPGRGWVVWPVIAVAGCLFELANFLTQADGTTPNHAHPVLSDIVEPWLASGASRAVFCAVWVVIGWWLLGALLRPVDEDES